MISRADSSLTIFVLGFVSWFFLCCVQHLWSQQGHRNLFFFVISFSCLNIADALSTGHGNHLPTYLALLLMLLTYCLLYLDGMTESHVPHFLCWLYSSRSALRWDGKFTQPYYQKTSASLLIKKQKLSRRTICTNVASMTVGSLGKPTNFALKSTRVISEIEKKASGFSASAKLARWFHLAYIDT